MEKAAAEMFDEHFLRKLEYLHIVARKVFSGMSRAERRTRRVGAGIEFADHRDYSHGDDLRYIDWNVYGRLDRLLLRLFEEEEDLHIYVLLDTSRSMGWGAGNEQPAKLQYAAHVAAALCYIGLSNLDRVGLVALSDGLRERLPPARGKNRIFKVLRFLAGLRPEGNTNLLASVRSFVHQAPHRGLAVLLSDLYDPAGYQDALSLLQHHQFEPFVLHLFAAEEVRPPIKGDVILADCETGEERQLTVSPAILARYAQAHGEYMAGAERFCTARQVPYFRACTDVPFDEFVLRILRRGGFLQ